MHLTLDRGFPSRRIDGTSENIDELTIVIAEIVKKNVDDKKARKIIMRCTNSF